MSDSRENDSSRNNTNYQKPVENNNPQQKQNDMSPELKNDIIEITRTVVQQELKPVHDRFTNIDEKFKQIDERFEQMERNIGARFEAQDHMFRQTLESITMHIEASDRRWNDQRAFNDLALFRIERLESKVPLV